MRIKRMIISCLIVGMVMLSVGCDAKDASSIKPFNQSKNVQDVLDSYVTESDDLTLITPKPEEHLYDAMMESTEGVDVDLTVLSATMVYTEVYNMMVSPQEYIGKTIRMEGSYAPYHDDETGKDYSACIIQDATQCCQQGIEFELEGKKPYPKEGEEICVTGVFETYKEGEATYCILKHAKIES